MVTVININMADYLPEPEPTDVGEVYPLLPGMTRAVSVDGERKLKKKKKKNCTNGQVCGFSCISKTKTCTANMTTAQFMEHNRAKRLAAAEKRKAAKAAKMASTATKPSSGVTTYQEAIERGKAIADPFLKDVQKDIEKVNSLNSEYLKVLDEIEIIKQEEQSLYKMTYGPEYLKKKEELSSRLSGLVVRRSEIERDTDQQVTNIASAMSGVLRTQVKISDEEAIAMTEKVLIDRARLSKTRRVNKKAYKHDIGELSEGMTEFNQLTRGQANLSILTLTKNRASAYQRQADGANIVNVGTPAKTKVGIKSTLFHEMAHHVETQNPTIEKITTDWRQSRATGDPVQLKKLNPSKKYEDDEIAYPDKFISPYVGRTYELDGIKGTEVLSVGMEHFSTPSRMGLLYSKDPDHFYLTLGIMDSL